MWLKWFPWKYIVSRLAKSQGFIDPVELLSRARRFSQPSEVAEPLELVRAGMAFQARGFMNSRAIQQNLDWVWPYWVCQQFNPHSKSFIPRAFSLTHINMTNRNWTAVGLPGSILLPIVDPRGLITPWFDSWSIDCWMLNENGTLLAPSRYNTVEQSLSFEGNLAVTTKSMLEEMELQSTVCIEIQGGKTSCCISVKGRSRSNAWLIISLRPYNPEGVSFIHSIQLNDVKNQWLVNHKQPIHFNVPVEKNLVSDYQHGDVSLYLFNKEVSNSVNCNVGMATAAAIYKIPENGERKIRVAIEEPEKTMVNTSMRKYSSAQQLWTELLCDSCKLELPDNHFQFLYNSAIRTLLLHTTHDVYAGPFTYKRFWFRDAAFILNALLSVGFTSRAERMIEKFFSRQTSAGYFRSQEGEWDSNGQVLWILNHYCEVTNSQPKRSWINPIIRAANWIQRKRISSEKYPERNGLLPAGFSAEHLGPNDYYYWDDFWCAAGLFAAAEMMERAGKQKEENKYNNIAEQLMQAIHNSLTYVQQRTSKPMMPASVYRRMDSGAIGSVVAGYPLQLIAPDEPVLLNTVEYLISNCLVQGGFFQDMIHSGINPYLTLHLAQVLMSAGDIRFRDMMCRIASLSSPTGQWPEAIHPHTGGGCMGDGQHVWAASEWIMALKNAIIYEKPASNQLVIGKGIFPEWLETGNKISLGPACTRWGRISVTITCMNGEIQIIWNKNWHKQPPEIIVEIPGFSPVRAENKQSEIQIKR